MLEVQQLEQTYGFLYSSVIEMLIFLLNTATVLQYAIRKLARFNALRGKKHFKALINLLHHVRTHKHDFGTKFYPPGSNPPIYDLVEHCQPDFDFSAFLIIIFCDSSRQDCVDTGRSRGAYHIYVNRSLVKSTTFVLIPIAHSSTKAEYNTCAFALNDAIYVKQV